MEAGRQNDPFAELLGELTERLRGDRWQPAVDVYETENAVVVRAELAGVRTADLRVSVDGAVLRIRGVRVPPAEAGVQRLHRMEIAFGPFERVVRLTIPFERDQVAARLEEGFLRVTLPKRVPVRRRVEVVDAGSEDE